MASKVLTTELKVGMFVADLDRPWVDTPFLLQGFLIEDEAQIAELRTYCDYVIVDRARSTGAEYQAPPPSAVRTASSPNPAMRRAPVGATSADKAAPARNGSVPEDDPRLAMQAMTGVSSAQR